MTASDVKSAAVLELAEEFLERYRRGERPSLKEYIDRHPDLEAEIREVFPAMAMMENVAVDDSLAEKSRAAVPVGVATQLGDFRLIREVGRGGMGVVYEAEQVSLRRVRKAHDPPGDGGLAASGRPGDDQDTGVGRAYPLDNRGELLRPPGEEDPLLVGSPALGRQEQVLHHPIGDVGIVEGIRQEAPGRPTV